MLALALGMQAQALCLCLLRSLLPLQLGKPKSLQLVFSSGAFCDWQGHTFHLS